MRAQATGISKTFPQRRWTAREQTDLENGERGIEVRKGIENVGNFGSRSTGDDRDKKEIFHVVVVRKGGIA